MLIQQYVFKNTSCFTMYKNGIPKTRKFVRQCIKSTSKFRARNWVEINDE